MQPFRSIWLPIFPILLSLGAATVDAQPVDPSRGVDARVDYPALKAIGPWDDRNYNLTREDLALLAPNEAELRAAVPAFFRVGLRRHWQEIGVEAPSIYPRAALQVFRMHHGGYLVNGKIYRGVTLEPDGYRVLLESGVEARTLNIDQAALELLVDELPLRKFLTGDVRVSSPEGNAESAVKIHPTDTSRVIAGSNSLSGQIMHLSTDGGVTWSDAGALPLGNTCCDPTVDWSSDGSLAYTATLGGCGFFTLCNIWVYRSDDGGATWNGLENVTPGDPRRELTSSQDSDKEFIHVDKATNSAHRDNVYLAWHDNNVQQFARSTDSANTWSITSFTGEPAGIGSDICTDKAGVVYYVYPTTSASPEIRLLRSLDGGASFAGGAQVAALNDGFIFPVPSMEARQVFIYSACDADLSEGPFGGSVYIAWTDATGAEANNPVDNHARIQLAYSRDAGLTWTTTTPHPTADAMEVDRYHPWLAVDTDGTVHVIFYDTSADADRTTVDIFHSFSTDGGVTFSTPERRTTASSANIVDGFEFGDYNGLDAVMQDVIGVFTDNRDEDGSGGDSVDVYAVGIPAPPPQGETVFEDGFESGDCTLWSTAAPALGCPADR